MKNYGLDENQINSVKRKLDRQDKFLSQHGFRDKANNNSVPFKNIVFSACHNPKRYYAEIQNKVNTFVKVAKEKNLKPIFMTLTLPTDYHKQKVSKDGSLVCNKNYAGYTPQEGQKELTKMFAKLRQDRSLKELSKDERCFFKVLEPHSDGTPHAHILLFVPENRICKVVTAFNRLFCNNTKANDIQTITDKIDNAVGYIMKYINKALPASNENLSKHNDKLQYWYSFYRIIRFTCSQTLAPITIYRKVNSHLSLYALTRLYKNKELKIYVSLDSKILLEIRDKDTNVVYYQKNTNIAQCGYCDILYSQYEFNSYNKDDEFLEEDAA